MTFERMTTESSVGPAGLPTTCEDYDHHGCLQEPGRSTCVLPATPTPTPTPPTTSVDHPYNCDTCADTGRVEWMIEGDPNVYNPPDKDGKVPCPDCTVATSDPIDVTYVGTLYDRVTEDDGGSAVVEGLPYRAESDGLLAAATTPEGARAMIERMRAAHPVPTPRHCPTCGSWWRARIGAVPAPPTHTNETGDES